MRLKDTGFLRVRLSWLEFLDFRHSFDHFISCEWLSTKQYFRSFSALRHKHELLSCILRAFLSLCLILIFVHPLFSWGGLFHNAAWLRMLYICVLSIIPTTSYPSKVVTHFMRYPAPCFVWTVTNSIFVTLEPVWFLTFDLNFTYCLYWSICCSLSLSVSVLDIHIGCLVYLRVTIMWHTTMTVNHG